MSKEKHIEAVKKHQIEKCDAIMLRPSKEDGARYREAAARFGMPVQKFFFSAAEEYIAKYQTEEAPPWEDDEELPI